MKKAKQAENTAPYSSQSKENLLVIIEGKDNEIFKLRTHLAYLIRQKFGRKSERFVDLNQLSLFDMQELLTKEEIGKETDTEQTTEIKTKKKKPKRKPLAEDLPRKTKIIEPENLPEGAKKIGEEVTEKLEFTPGEFWVLRIVRPKYVIPEDETIVIGELPSFAIDKSIAGASLLAHLLVGKYVDHIPFYRAVEILKRAGVKLPKATINGWFMKATDLLDILYQELKKQTLNSEYIQADETTIKVQCSNKPKSTHQGYFWVYNAPLKGALFFEYNSSRAKTVPQKTLSDFTGVLQTDGYAGYEDLPNKSKIIRLSCMAHARRYFEKAKDEVPDKANYALSQIQRLYAIERQAKELTIEERYELRQKLSVPILNEIETWLKTAKNNMLPKSLFSRACTYAINHWSRLCEYTNNGTYIIDNNQIENKIRPVALGRKNYLFAGSEEAAQRAAIMYSLMASCKMHEVNPYLWLKDILDKIPDYKARNIADLLPANWKAQNNSQD